MNLHEYEDPNDPYAPRAKASQAVAAAKRAAQVAPGRPTHDTEPIAPVQLSRRHPPFGIGALVLVVVIAASYQLAQLSSRPLAIPPAATVPAQTLQHTPVASPEAPTATIAPKRTIDAYAAPDGLLLGQIEEDRMIVPVAHYGAGWIQADVAGSGLVWLRAVDVPDVAITGPDLAPVAAQPAQSGQGLTLSQKGNDAGGWTTPEAAHVSDKGTKPVDDAWAARRATAIARSKQPHEQKGP